jgi:hypothetical protein
MYNLMATYKEQVLEDSLKKMAEKVVKLEQQNEKLLQEISLANRFIKSQKEYYLKLTNKNQ